MEHKSKELCRSPGNSLLSPEAPAQRLGFSFHLKLKSLKSTFQVGKFEEYWQSQVLNSTWLHPNKTVVSQIPTQTFIHMCTHRRLQVKALPHKAHVDTHAPSLLSARCSLRSAESLLFRNMWGSAWDDPVTCPHFQNKHMTDLSEVNQIRVQR